MKANTEFLQVRQIGPHTEEAELVEHAKKGNEAAIREVIRRLNPRLFRVARGIVDSDAEAEEIVQDTYLIVFSRIAEFRGESKLATWVTKIALNAARMSLRKHHFTEEYDSVAESHYQGASVLEFPGVKNRTPESEQGRAQFREWVEAAVSKLPSQLRVVFVLREAEGMSMGDIAADLGVSVMTVKTRLFRARRHIRSTLEAQIKGGFEMVYPFDGLRCANMADSVIELLQDFISA
ncbi:RNA polymerase sigma factor [Marinobacter sp.]|uniref:RNA polymerase sigma factor n=1 Tax=Marinobacter sp. TaxID=50741 RepID=UPI001B437599|nr:RNA polymerase sigma factor [Marinobacter sp.]MBQ0831571.1 RNA polymerase sigma factor [Marinobacter sp.]